jgi:hypothetical protein
LGVPTGPLDTILRCLGTEVDSLEDLIAARSMIARAIDGFARAVAPDAEPG